MNKEVKETQNEELKSHREHAKTAEDYTEHEEDCIFCAALEHENGKEAAYISIVGEEYANKEDCEEAYNGQFSSDKEFAQEQADATTSLNSKELQAWPHYCIDWEWAARELMMDYSEEKGHYFRNL